MEQKIIEYFSSHNLGKVISMKEDRPWKDGKRFHVISRKILQREYTVYEKSGELDTVRNLQMNKEF